MQRLPEGGRLSPNFTNCKNNYLENAQRGVLHRAAQKWREGEEHLREQAGVISQKDLILIPFPFALRQIFLAQAHTLGRDFDEFVFRDVL